MKDEEVILIKPYEILTTTSKTILSKTAKMSFIYEEIENLEKYMKFVLL